MRTLYEAFKTISLFLNFCFNKVSIKIYIILFSKGAIVMADPKTADSSGLERKERTDNC